MEKIRVAVFDDNDLFRDGLQMLIDLEPNMCCVGAFPDCTNVVEHVRKIMPDVILMDIEMPNVGGIEGVLLIKKYYPKIKVIMQTVFENNEKVVASMCAGADGYLLKKTSPEKLVEGIMQVCDGGVPMSPALAWQVLQLIDPKSKIENVKLDLSARELEILKLLSHGHSYKMIANKLDVSYSTINSHTKHIYEKLQVHSVVDAVMKAVQKKII